MTDQELIDFEERIKHFISTCPFRSITDILKEQQKFIEQYKVMKKQYERMKDKLEAK